MVPIMTLCVSRFTPALSPTHRHNPAMLATNRMRPKANDPKQGFNPPDLQIPDHGGGPLFTISVNFSSPKTTKFTELGHPFGDRHWKRCH